MVFLRKMGLWGFIYVGVFEGFRRGKVFFINLRLFILVEFGKCLVVSFENRRNFGR